MHLLALVQSILVVSILESSTANLYGITILPVPVGTSFVFHRPPVLVLGFGRVRVTMACYVLNHRLVVALMDIRDEAAVYVQFILVQVELRVLLGVRRMGSRHLFLSYLPVFLFDDRAHLVQVLIGVLHVLERVLLH